MSLSRVGTFALVAGLWVIGSSLATAEDSTEFLSTAAGTTAARTLEHETHSEPWQQNRKNKKQKKDDRKKDQRHKHKWAVERVWVEPVTRRVKVGVDKNGKPIEVARGGDARYLLANEAVLSVEPGQEVKAGEEIAVIEAKKMENILRAEKDGKIVALHAEPGDSLAVDQSIVEFE